MNGGPRTTSGDSQLRKDCKSNGKSSLTVSILSRFSCKQIPREILITTYTRPAFKVQIEAIFTSAGFPAKKLPFHCHFQQKRRLLQHGERLIIFFNGG